MIIKSKVFEVLRMFQDREKLNTELEKVLHSEGIFGHPFNGLQTYHQQLKYYKDKFGLLVSQKIIDISYLCIRIGTCTLCSWNKACVERSREETKVCCC